MSLNINNSDIKMETYDNMEPDNVQEEQIKPVKRSSLFLPIRKAQEKGATPSQILEGISSKHPEYAQKIETARSQGATDDQIFKAISDRPEITESPIRKTGRLATQYAIGSAEAATLPYNLGAVATHTLAEGSKRQEFRQNILDDMTSALEMKGMGIWSEQDQKTYDAMQKLIENPEGMEEYLSTLPRYDVGSLIEKGFELGGIDMQPEDIPENASRWIGFIKDPKKLYSAAKKVSKDPAGFVKAIKPTLTEIGRGLGSGTGLEIAEAGAFGPIGTIASMLAGEALGAMTAIGSKAALRGGLNIAKTAGKIVREPKVYKKALKQKTAKTVEFLTRNSRKDITESIAESMEKSGIEADLGSLTNSNVIKTVQTALEQSGLTGNDLESLRTRITKQFEDKYKDIIGDIGEFKFSTIDEAGDAVRNAAKEADLPFFSKKLESSREAQKGLSRRIPKEAIPEYVDNFLWKVSKEPTESRIDVGKGIKSRANKNRETIKKEFNKDYTRIKGELGDITTTQEGLAKELKKFIKDNKGSLLKDSAPAEKKVIEAANKLYNELIYAPPEFKGKMAGFEDIVKKQREKVGVKYKPVTIDSLWKTKTTLGEIADFDFGKSNFKTKFKKIYGLVNESIQEVLDKESPELSKELRNVDKRYSAFKDNFENDLVESLFRKDNKKYSKIYNDFMNHDSIARLEPVLNQSKLGSRLIDQVKRDFAEKILKKKDLTIVDINDLQKSIGYDSQLGHGRLKESYNKLRKEFSKAKEGVKQSKIKTPVTKEMRPTTPKTGRRQIQPERVSKEVKINSLVEKQARQNLEKLIGKKTPTQIFNMMNTVDGIKNLERLLNKTPEGEKLVNSLKRLKIEKMIGENMVDSVTEQLKTGTFSKLLEKGHNKAIARHILGEKSFNDLMYLQKHAGKLAKSSQKFYNSSKTATTRRDLSTLNAILIGATSANPFLLRTTIGTLAGGKGMAKLISDPEFLSMVKDAILAGESNDVKLLDKAWRDLLTKFNEIAPELKKSAKGAVVENS